MEVRVGHICCECVIRLLETQVVDDVSRARSRASREHIVHCFVTLELSRDDSRSDSVFSAVQIPACRHSLLPESNVHVHGLVHSKLCESVRFCQIGLRRLLSLRIVNKRIQQFSCVFVAVEVLQPPSYSERPSASLGLADALPVEARPVSSVVRSAARLVGVVALS